MKIQLIFQSFNLIYFFLLFFYCLCLFLVKIKIKIYTYSLMSLLLYTDDRYDESAFEDDENYQAKKDTRRNNYYLSSTDMNST
jgi:hypothetical protein